VVHEARTESAFARLSETYAELQDYTHELEVKNQKLHDELNNIAHLIHYQCHLKVQDRWVAHMIETGLVVIAEDDDDDLDHQDDGEQIT